MPIGALSKATRKCCSLAASGLRGLLPLGDVLGGAPQRRHVRPRVGRDVHPGPEVAPRPVGPSRPRMTVVPGFRVVMQFWRHGREIEAVVRVRRTAPCSRRVRWRPATARDRTSRTSAATSRPRRWPGPSPRWPGPRGRALLPAGGARRAASASAARRAVMSSNEQTTPVMTPGRVVYRDRVDGEPEHARPAGCARP